jgi:hypothetical protein
MHRRLAAGDACSGSRAMRRRDFLLSADSTVGLHPKFPTRRVGDSCWRRFRRFGTLAMLAVRRALIVRAATRRPARE